MSLLNWFLSLFRRSQAKIPGQSVPMVENFGPDETRLFLQGETDRKWKVLSREAADLYARDCRFIVAPEEDCPYEVLVIANPHPKSDGPAWAIYGRGDLFLATGDSLPPLLIDPDVMAVLRGEITVDQFWWRGEKKKRRSA